MRGLLVDGLQLGARVLERLGDTFALVGCHLDIAAQLFDAAAQVALGKDRLLRRALQLTQLLACRREAPVQRFEGALVRFVGGLLVGQRGIVLLETRLRLGADGALLPAWAAISSRSARIWLLRAA